MRWTSLGTKRFSVPPFFIPPLIFPIDIKTTSILKFLKFQSFRHQSSLSNYSPNEPVLETLHAKLIKNGSVLNLLPGNYLLDLYVKSQNWENAYKLFDEIPDREVRTWTILLSGLARVGHSKMALDLFREMQVEGVCPNHFTLSSVLKCCSSVNELRIGKEIHGWIVRNGICLDAVLENSILDVYVKCGAIDYGERVFDFMKDGNTVSWNILVGGYLYMGEMEKALDLFRRLPFKDVVSWNTVIDGLTRNGFGRTGLDLLYEMVETGPVFDKVTFSISLVLVSGLSKLELGRQIHGRVMRIGIYNDRFIRTSLIDMYCKCGQMEKALVIFQKLPKDFGRMNFNSASDDLMTETISWSSVVSGYVRNGKYDDALKTIITMVHEGVKVDKFTLTSIISAFSNTGILDFGRQIHAYIQKIGHKIDVYLNTSLIDMYSKCGSLDDAWSIFNQTNDLNVASWTSMISGCALHGQGRAAIRLFELMISKGIIPNEITFVGVLTGCSHAGLLEEGCKYFQLMKEVYYIKPGVEHFTCMVDLYGRAGHLDEINEFIQTNGISRLSVVWKSFLSSCRLHKNIEMGKWVSKKLLEVEPLDSGSYVLLSNMCATEHRWEEAAKLRGLMQQRGVKKLTSQSWIQLKNRVHTFVLGDRSHPQVTEIYAYLDRLIGRLKEIGYSSDVKVVMQDVEEEQGEMLLRSHSEKLAIAYGIICTTSGTPLRIMKNLRVCTDCHNFIKYTSQLLEREIIVRDIHRFHHFKHGHCSCGDYW